MSRIETESMGAGICHAGVALAGFGEVATVTISNSQDLVTAQSTIGNARYINPKTGDYELNSNGFLVGTDIIQQSVYLALVTVKGTSIEADLGQNYTNSKVVSPNLSTQIKSQTQQALNKLIQNKKIELLSTTVVFPSNDPNAVTISVKWKKLQSGEVFTTSV